MKAVILAGGYGTRLSEETTIKPKPMVEIGGYPMLWHIMKIYAHYGVNEFIVCCGYKGELIKEYFQNYHLRNADLTFDLSTHNIKVHKNGAEKWKVTLVDTGENSMTGGRLKRIKEYIGNETFFFTYGDGVSDVDLTKLVEFHKSQGVLATLTAIQPPGRFGVFTLGETDTKVTHFMEKPKGDGAWINGGYFVAEPEIFDYIEGDQTIWEQDPMRKLAHAGKLGAYKHTGFWQNMDTLRDKMVLEDMWTKGQAPWKLWK